MIDEARRRIQACKESRSKILDLGNCGLTNETIPEELWELICLEELNFGNNYCYDKVKRGGWYLFNKATKNPNQLVRIPYSIRSLSKLLYLNLAFNQVKELENLEHLLQLTSLNLVFNKIDIIKGINNLTRLTHLYLSGNQIKEITGLDNLGKLTNLWLRTNQINEIKNLDRLLHLKELSLEGNKISEIKGLDKLTQLTQLWLDSNQISEIKGLDKLTQLTQLSLSSNQISEIKGLDKLTQLTQLSLSSNQIYAYPDELFKGYDHNCLPDLKAWQAALAQGKSQNQSIKIVLCGNGNVGKSCVLDALQGREYVEKDSTHAIEIERVDMEEVEAWVWDMGGQEVYHGTHRLFMRSEAIYLLVWDAETEELPEVADRENTGLTYRNHKLPYWIDLIRAASPDSPILLVQNKIDAEGHIEKPAHPSVDEYIAISAKKRINIDELQHKIKRLAKKHKPLRYGMDVPSSWWAVRSHILDLLHQKSKGLRIENIISYAQFETLCTRYEVMPKTVPSLLRLLHRSGVVFYQKGKFGNQIIIDQTWAIQAIYKVLDRRSDFFKQVCGRQQFFYQSELFAHWSDEKYTQEDKKVLLGMMEQAHLCFKINEYAKEENPKYIVPRLLSAVQPPSVGRIWRRIQSDICYLRYQHRFMHYGIIQQFLIRMGRKTALDMIWQNGIAFAMGDNEALVVADFEQDSICVQTYGPQALPLMQAIRKEFWNIYGQKEVEVSVSKDGTAFIPKKTIEEFQKYNTGEAYADLFWVLQPPNRDANLNLDALPDVEQHIEQLNSKTMKAFVSYRHHEKDKALKEEIINNLSNLNRIYDFEIWADTQITAGSEWEKEIASNLQEADIIFLLISADFINSDYIWGTEVPKAIERHDKGEATVIPIILRPCLWNVFNFSKLQVLPTEGKPISKWDDRDDAMLDIVKGVKKILEQRL